MIDSTAFEKILQIPIEQLERGKYQPRREFEQESLDELAQSIRKQGIFQPLVIRKIARDKYEIVAGERRWRAAQLVRLSTVPCLLKYYTDEEAAEISLIENLQRKDLTPIEEAYAYQRLIKEFNYTHAVLAESLGKGRSAITNRLRLLELDDRVQEFLKKDTLKEGHARVLAGLNLNQQYPLAKECIEKDWSVRQLEKAVARIKNGTEDKKSFNESAYFRRFEQHLGDQLGTEVCFEREADAKSGYIRIKYFDADTLSGLLERMGVKSESD
ncbi:MAG: ParB/RepB/Spo0J family partition protein [Gammaproteobacteria bacterium]